ncbi:MAG: UDP-N-acetylmuramoyl-L-alanyl-D-glutamate--2,6-diaminopimelate ligase [Desulfuromonadales bacterium]|nr:UDP-N-acetylmuramoyl-L-alanyl-D-glutamate--2,6-diaminopimelate ligase [Desulfuromonadales bacterium]
MTLTKLLTRIKPEKIVGPATIEISGLACDSRQVQPESLFFALPGVKADGFDYIPQALERGAAAIVCQRLPQHCPEGICFIQLNNVRLAMAKIAAEYYGDPSRGIPVIGVTGTNGKTTVTYLLEAILRAAGRSPAVFGTVEYRFNDHRIPASHTTPESLELMHMMADFRERGADVLILEVSSHALEQHRVDGIHFDIAVFTNLTPEHLDYHLSLESYFSSKRRLFSELLSAGTAVINHDDPFGRRLLKDNPDWVAFGADNAADVHPQKVMVARDGIEGTFMCADKILNVSSGMIGDFNVSNLMAAMAAAQQLGLDQDVIIRGIASAPQVPGRLEKIANQVGVLALVDYAHTGDALEQVLNTLAKLDSRRIITVVGCGGDRDPGKRPVMAAVAVKYSDLAVFTSDNPRTEDPLKILEQVRAGALNAGGDEFTAEQIAVGYDGKGFIVIPDRRSAIEFAAQQAQEGDLLLVAGKGHEDYQILGTEKIHFDDREELARVLRAVTPTTPTKAGEHV